MRLPPPGQSTRGDTVLRKRDSFNTGPVCTRMMTVAPSNAFLSDWFGRGDEHEAIEVRERDMM